MLNFDWISHINPGAAKFIMLCAFLVPLIFTLSLKKSYIYAGSSDMKLWKNLKIWVTLLTLLMLFVYWSF